MNKVLVVEDDRLLGKELIRVFIENDITAVWARTIQEAIDALSTESIGLALLDVMLSNGESGLEILKHIQADEKLKTIPVVMLTNEGPIEHINHALELGAKDYIVKVNTDLEKVAEIAKKYLTGVA